MPPLGVHPSDGLPGGETFMKRQAAADFLAECIPRHVDQTLVIIAQVRSAGHPERARGANQHLGLRESVDNARSRALTLRERLTSRLSDRAIWRSPARSVGWRTTDTTDAPRLRSISERDTRWPVGELLPIAARRDEPHE